MLVSVIMPVYNAERYLRESIESVLNQTYSDIEFIIIDDGSTDDSLKIISEYENIDNRVKCITKRNSGVSNSRNIALKIAKGENILFIDSDDLYKADYVEKLIDKSEEYDLVICGYSQKFINKNLDIISNKALNTFSDLQISILESNDIGGFVWNKLFKKKIIDKYNLKFKEDIFVCEDLLFLFEYIEKCHNYVYLRDTLYQYRMRENSATSAKNYRNKCSELEAYRLLLEQNFQPEVERLIICRYVKNYYKIKNCYKNKKNEYNPELRKYEKKILNWKSLPSKEFWKIIILKYKLGNIFSLIRNNMNFLEWYK